jgi:HTH-type transcriptional regulator/antitoxin MqsA
MDVKDVACPSCEAKTLGLVSRSLTVEHQGKQVEVDGLEGCLCTTCGADPVLMPQIRANQVRIADAKRKAFGLMTGAEIKALRKHFRLSQPAAAETFAGGANAFSKYERGEIIQSVAMDKLMRAALKHHDLVEDWQSGVSRYVATATAPARQVPVNLDRSEPRFTPTSGPLCSVVAESIPLEIVGGVSGEGWLNADCANDDRYALAVGYA